jgi:L-alanine-DL-glutamate epimerase-like enolase superfamily enzyme
MIEKSKIIPLPPVDWGDNVKKDVVLIEITTLEGITGLGSAYTGVSQMRDALDRYQQDPQSLHIADAKMTIPMSAIDIALWDIRGKEENQPVSELLGGRKHDRILAYATVDLPMTSATAGDVFDKLLRSVVDQGFGAVKICIDKFGHRDNSKTDKNWDLCEAKLLRFARSIVGKNVQLMLDVYGSDPEWTGDFENLSNLKTVNILQPDCTRVGGLTKMQSIRNVASQNNMELIPHGWNTAVGLAADLQLQATMAGDRYCMVEYMPHRAIADRLKHNPFALDDEGKITVPTGAGLGVELNDNFKN